MACCVDFHSDFFAAYGMLLISAASSPSACVTLCLLRRPRAMTASHAD
jgi:hypothetical protein